MGKGIHEVVRSYRGVQQPLYRGMSHPSSAKAGAAVSDKDMYRKDPVMQLRVDGQKIQLESVYKAKVSSAGVSRKAPAVSVFALQRGVLNQAKKEMQKALQKAEGSGVLKVGYIPQGATGRVLTVVRADKGFKASLNVSSMLMEVTLLDTGDVLNIDMNRRGPVADYVG